MTAPIAKNRIIAFRHSQHPKIDEPDGASTTGKPFGGEEIPNNR
jgi:hypothetical protein